MLSKQEIVHKLGVNSYEAEIIQDIIYAHNPSIHEAHSVPMGKFQRKGWIDVLHRTGKGGHRYRIKLTGILEVLKIE